MTLQADSFKILPITSNFCLQLQLYQAVIAPMFMYVQTVLALKIRKYATVGATVQEHVTMSPNVVGTYNFTIVNFLHLFGKTQLYCLQ